MRKSIVSCLLALPLALLLFATPSQRVFTKETKSTPSSKDAELKCNQKLVNCTNDCKNPFGFVKGKKSVNCADSCNEKHNTCLNNIKLVGKPPKGVTGGKKATGGAEQTTNNPPKNTGGKKVTGGTEQSNNPPKNRDGGTKKRH
jgi:hypothetical protein